jgi:hypothetical protein
VERDLQILKERLRFVQDRVDDEQGIMRQDVI